MKELDGGIPTRKSAAEEPLQASSPTPVAVWLRNSCAPLLILVGTVEPPADRALPAFKVCSWLSDPGHLGHSLFPSRFLSGGGATDRSHPRAANPSAARLQQVFQGSWLHLRVAGDRRLPDSNASRPQPPASLAPGKPGPRGIPAQPRAGNRLRQWLRGLPALSGWADPEVLSRTLLASIPRLSLFVPCFSRCSLPIKIH